MKTVTMTMCVIQAVLFTATSQGFGIDLSDGGTYNIDYPAGNVSVDNGAPGMKTTVNLLDGGSIWKWWAYQDSRIGISGGSVGLWLVAYDRAQVAMSGGQIWYLDAYDASQVTMSGGLATGDVIAEGGSHVTLSGGAVLGYLTAADSSQVIMSGGSVAGLLGAGGSSQVTLSGGTIAQTLDLYQNAILYLDGRDFAVDGTRFSSGAVTSIFGGDYGAEPYRTVTGTLANGDTINNEFQIGGNARIVLVPEPVTAFLLALGGLSLVRRRRLHD